MPELPDVEVYRERLEALFQGHVLEKVEVLSPFTVRTFHPPMADLHGKILKSVARMGKRLILEFEPSLFLVIHLMIAGRLRLAAPSFVAQKKRTLAVFRFDNAALVFTEASTKKRAAIHLVKGKEQLSEFDRGGLDPLRVSLSAFKDRMRFENRTLKRALTDQRLMSGIGNAYSDEILHEAQLSPVKRTRSVSDEEYKRLWQAMKRILKLWRKRLSDEVGDGFPDKVTAFRPEMAVHGKYGQPCPRCGEKVQRIRFASNEMNYCPPCQTGGKLLADRGLSRLLKGDWPKTLEELDEIKQQRTRSGGAA